MSSIVDISPVPADRSTGSDVYGNRDLYFQVSAPHEELVVAAESEIEVYGPDKTRLAAAPANAPWELSRPRGNRGGRWRRSSCWTSNPPEISDAVREYAAPSFPPKRPPLVDAVVDLTTRIHRDFQYKSGSTSISTRVAEALEKRSGGVPDFARLAIACLRSRGLAARYVSGYLATQPPPGKERMIASTRPTPGRPCGCRGDRWLAFDPHQRPAGRRAVHRGRVGSGLR